ncbi:hypothetical protein PQX77_018361 [Marasmius sp. AFHP31]|nr:hypothetical protein PQX77_018361 [Marasmius sp. AFHP31]
MAQNVNYGRDQIIQTGAGNLNVTNIGRDLIQTFSTTVSNPHKALWRTVAAVGASHTSEQQYTRGTCLEGTRQKALGDIHTWRVSGNPSHPICWLFGTAGVGKSAIALTIAKACEEDGLAASFFFFRADPKRNNPSALMPTITLGLRSKIPSLRTFIDERIDRDPTILVASLEVQFEELILKPSLRMKRSGLEGESVQKIPNLVILDGLDECGDEDTQLRILTIILSSYGLPSTWSPLKFLICSRPEAWIREAFNEVHLSRVTKRINLNNASQTDLDIEQYFIREFEAIRTSPKFRRVQFPAPWPSEGDLRWLVRKASSQFVYAKTAAEFVKLPYSNPLDQLYTILHYDPGNQLLSSPFPELDRLYHIILSVNPNREKLLSILAAIFLLPPLGPPSPDFIELLLGLTSGDVDLALRSMHSVLNIQYGEANITAFHTSFSDYLFDRTRAGIFFINRPAQSHSLARQWLQALSAERLRQHRCKISYLPYQPRFLTPDPAAFAGRLGPTFAQPSRELLADLRNVELSAVLLFKTWPYNTPFRDLVCEAEPYVIDRLKKEPKHFHLESNYEMEEVPNAGFDNLEHAVIIQLSGYRWWQPLGLGGASRSSALWPFRVTDCRCDLERDLGRSSSSHKRYEAACLRALKALVSEASNYCSDSAPHVRYTFEHLIDSSLLQHSARDTLLVSSMPNFKIEERRTKLLDWLETCPQHYATEAETLKSEIMSLFKPRGNRSYRRSRIVTRYPASRVPTGPHETEVD